LDFFKTSVPVKENYDFKLYIYYFNLNNSDCVIFFCLLFFVFLCYLNILYFINTLYIWIHYPVGFRIFSENLFIYQEIHWFRITNFLKLKFFGLFLLFFFLFIIPSFFQFFSVCILQFSIFYALQLDLPSFSLMRGIPPSHLFITILLFLLYSVGSKGRGERKALYSFFLLFVLIHTSSPLSTFIGLRCPAAAIAESSSLIFTSGDKYGLYRIFLGTSDAEFSICHHVIAIVDLSNCLYV